MLNLSKKIKISHKITTSKNLCSLFPSEDLQAIGNLCSKQYDADLQSREKWEERSTAALNFAMQVQEDKNFPWQNCSNVKFPLITIAALQFHSRAYPALIDPPKVVKMAVVGEDPDGSKTARADRVETHMNWQLQDEDVSWEEQWDQALLYVPIVGTAWKKTYYNSELGHNCSDLVLAQDLVINYWAKNVDECPCKTQILHFSSNDIYKRIMQGFYRDVRDEGWYNGDAPQPPQDQASAESDNRAGYTRPGISDLTPFVVLEQHRNLDLDGDGYAEPYIVTFEESSHCVLRIVARWERDTDIVRTIGGEVIFIKSVEYFTKIPFIPSPDGGIMDIGFGTLLGPLNESVNTSINQLIDSGTIANTAGGFLGRGAKIRGGVYNFSPFRWNRVDSTGDDLRKSVVPLPVREPSNVLFQLLSLLVTYTEKISGAVEINTGGNPGQNTPASTSQIMVEQGSKVYGAIFKRIWRSLRGELKKWYILNGIHFPPSGVMFGGSLSNIKQSDYLGDPSSITPQASPFIMSDQQRFLQAQALMSVGRGNPLFNQDGIYLKYLEAMKIKDAGTVFLGMKKMQPLAPPEKMQVEMMKAQVQLQQLQFKKLQYISSLYEQQKLNEAKIVNLYAQAALAESQAGGVESANAVNKFRAQIEALRAVNDTIASQIGKVGGNDILNGQSGGNEVGSPLMEGEPGFPVSPQVGSPNQK